MPAYAYSAPRSLVFRICDNPTKPVVIEPIVQSIGTITKQLHKKTGM